MESKAKINVCSKSSMADDKIDISLQGLVPYARVTLKMNVTTRQGQGRLFVSFARFMADSTGCVDLSRDQSYGGSYSGIHQMGLFWSLKPSQEISKKYPRYLHVPDVTKPMKFSLYLYNINVTSIEDLNQLQSDGKLQEFQLDSCQFDRLYVKPDVKIEEKTDEKDGFIGTLYIPPGEGPHPGVIVMFPGIFEFKASLLASRGFAAMALSFRGPLEYFHEYGDSVPRCDLNYFKKTVDFMVGHPNIISSGVGLLSNSFVSHLALLVATHIDNVKCVVCINGELHNGVVSYRLGDKVLEGSDSGFMRKFYDCVTRSREEIIDMSVLFPKLSLSELLKKEGLIPFYKKKDVAFMYVAGLDDEFLPAGHFADLFENLMEEANHPNFQVHKYSNAGHLIEPPYSPLIQISKLQGRPVKWGGSTSPHALAQEHSWKKQINFFRKNIAGCTERKSEANMQITRWLTRSITLARKTFKMF